MLISEKYRDLNRQLHATIQEYGTSGKLYVDEVKQIAKRIGTQDILDYGSGKCTLQLALGRPIRNYDPAVPELAVPPLPAAMVVCTDVLEHIEPDCLEAVLNDLKRVTLDLAFLVVATGPAVKSLPDGRNTHLLQQPFTWWLEHLEKRFRTVRYWGTPHGFVYIGRSFARQFEVLDLSDIGPAVQTKKMEVGSAYTDEERCTNIRSSMLRGLPSIQPLPPHDRIMTIACFGPSLIDTVLHIPREKSDVYTVSGAHDVLLRHGVKPIGHIESDPRPHKALLINEPKQDICYFLASACHRVVFDKLTGYERWLYHVTSSAMETNLIASMDRGGKAFTIDGGTNVGMTAIGVGTVLGYRKFSIHAMDCSFKCDDEIRYWPRDKPLPPQDEVRRRVGCHAGKHPNENQMIMRVWLEDVPWVTSPQMLQGAQDFLTMYRTAPHCRFQLHGDGYLPALMKYIGKGQRL